MPNYGLRGAVFLSSNSFAADKFRQIARKKWQIKGSAGRKTRFQSKTT
jgi:hypothetical protein